METGKHFYLTCFFLCISCFIQFSNCQVKKNTPPYFTDFLERELVTVGIPEDTPIGTVLGVLKAKDNEGDAIEYRCDSQTVECSPKGVVTLVRPLDREDTIKNPSELANLLKATFIAIEVNNSREEPSLVKAVVQIYVTDINDNKPQFQNVPYQTKVSENATVGLTVFKGVSVTDIDSGINAEITLSCYTVNAEDVESCDYFTINTVRDNSGEEGRYNGIVILKKPVDYEKRSSYVMSILAVDKGTPAQSSSVNLLIIVNDYQDNPPFFLQSPYTVFISEGTPPNTPITQLKAQDGDTGNPNPVKIFISDPQGYFILGPTVPDVGIIYASNLSLIKPLDRETMGARYTFNISVQEVVNGVLDPFSKVNSFVNVEIIDENDNAPRFLKNEYTMIFREFIKSNGTGALVGNPIVAVDGDTASNAKFSIEITSQTIPGVFGVSPTTGIKSTAVSLIALEPYYLDYDNAKYRNQTIVITARQTDNAKKLSSSTTVYIILTDENDNAPVFDKARYSAFINEDAPIGTTVLSLQATDKDSGRNKEISYIVSGFGSDYFSVDKNGNVILRRALDFELLSTFNLLAFARDNGAESLMSSVDVVITVRDVNDNGPVFNPKTYSTNIQELSTVFEPSITVQATDKDTGTKIQYSIESGNTIDNAFEINPDTGVLSLKRPIKTEDAKGNSGTILLRVKATDNGNPPRSSIVPVNINILDSNNNAPEFLQTIYEKSLKELTPRGTYVLTVNATDSDQGVNAQLEYSILSGNFDDFRVEPKTGKIYVSSQANLDYDVRKEYNMVVAAEDLGAPRLTGTASVVIKLIDINNKKPTFDKNEYYATINEITAPNTSILKVTATDNDADSELEYSINEYSMRATKSDGQTFLYTGAFSIDSRTGEIKTKIKLSQSYTPRINFEVLVRDLKADPSSSQTQIGRARVYVIIHASKREMPYFIPEDIGQGKKIYKLTLPEDKNEGLRITRLQAMDPITGRIVTNYRLVPDSTTRGFFNITNDGYVYLMKKLDYETLNSNPLTFEILAISDQARTSTAEMQITVLDVNDNAPKFDSIAYVFNVSESERYPETVGYVKATDNDSGDYNRISYSIEGLGHQDFWMFPTGEIIVNKNTRLDYETNSVYYLQVTATDNPGGDTHKKSLVKLTIHVHDVNDNKPIFSTLNYTFFTTESSAYGDSIGTVSAKDLDSGSNSMILYSLQPVYVDGMNGQKIFDIQPQTGKIIAATKLIDVVEKSPITFKVIGRDQGHPQQIGEASVTVFISTSGVLDIPKMITPQPGRNVTIPEDQAVGSTVFRVVAKARINSSIIYSFDEPNNTEVRTIFSIDPNTGAIELIRKLDHEKRKYYYLLLKATDRNNASLYISRRLRINVGDVNDNYPTFKDCETYNADMTASVPENKIIKSYVTVVKACDSDSAPYNVVEYMWENSPNCSNAAANFTAFLLNKTTGEIITGQVFDYEKEKLYVLCVRVKPGPTPYNTVVNDDDQVQRIKVKIIDDNDNGPVFSNKTLFAVINEKTILGSEVIRVTADDADHFPHNRLKYLIIDINYNTPIYREVYPAANAFKVSENTGIIVTNLQSYTDFVRGDFKITLKAEDETKQDFIAITNVKVYVIQPRQRSRIIFPKSPNQNTENINDLIRKLNELNKGQFRSTEIYYHQGLKGIESFDKTDVCLIVENQDKILSLEENEVLLESYKAQEILKEYGVQLAGSCNPETTVSYTEWSVLWWVLVAFAFFIFVCTVILIIATCLLYRSHKKFMDSEKTNLIKD